MPCLLSTGRKLPCKSAFGGIKNVYLNDFGTIKLTVFDTTTCISTVTMESEAGKWFKYEVKGNSSLDTTVTSSRENGTTFYTQTLSLTLTYLDPCTQQELQTIAVARPYVIVEDYYGNFFLCGLENGMEVTGGTVVTGAAAGDLSGYTLTFEGMEETAPLFIDFEEIAVDAEQIVPN
mgnify:CR=1 FL=1|tara:strand:+ start:467 stop:997 length:531 start_codon:yes stop_codon:yes gene_type:complete